MNHLYKISSGRAGKTLFIFFLAILFHGCLDVYEDHTSRENDRELAAYIKANDLDVHKTIHGFYYEVINKSGSNIKPAPGDFIGINYKLRLLNGTIIDSLTSGPPVRFRHLYTKLYPQAIDLGLSFMEKGDCYRLYIPSYLAYHDMKIDTLMPAFSNIIAEITLVDVTDSAGQVQHELSTITNKYAEFSYSVESGTFYDMVEDGLGDTPASNELVTVTYSRWLLDRNAVDNGTFTFKITNVPSKFKNIGHVLQKMGKGDRAEIIVTSNKAYWDQAILSTSGRLSTAKVIPGSFAPEILIPPYSPLLYQIKMHE
jgi:FKBP-type peptidyl-prolyl cis-trans isomerase FkpA